MGIGVISAGALLYTLGGMGATKSIRAGLKIAGATAVFILSLPIWMAAALAEFDMFGVSTLEAPDFSYTVSSKLGKLKDDLRILLVDGPAEINKLMQEYNDPANAEKKEEIGKKLAKKIAAWNKKADKVSERLTKYKASSKDNARGENASQFIADMEGKIEKIKSIHTSLITGKGKSATLSHNAVDQFHSYENSIGDHIFTPEKLKVETDKFNRTTGEKALRGGGIMGMVLGFLAVGGGAVLVAKGEGIFLSAPVCGQFMSTALNFEEQILNQQSVIQSSIDNFNKSLTQ